MSGEGKERWREEVRKPGGKTRVTQMESVGLKVEEEQDKMDESNLKLFR